MTRTILYKGGDRMQVLNKQNLEKVFDKLSSQAEVFLPMQRGDQSGYFSWKSFNPEVGEVVLDNLNVVQSPKKVVLPQTERMYDFQLDGNDVKVDKVYEDSGKRIIFGARACDVKAIDCLDKVFLTRGFEDEYYKVRRANTVIIAHACYQPGPNCFCQAMGVNCTDSESADVILRDTTDGNYTWEAKTALGEEITAIIAEILTEGQPEVEKLQPFTLKVDYEGTAEILKNMFNHPVWESLSEPCMNCGICTYLCPTCYCFDIQVKSWGDDGYRFRCWDSCMYSEYTQMAGGHNPRAATTERFRNRFLHKLQFFNERYGPSLCTGCGRCIIACPAGINITRIIAAIKEVNAGAQV
jgi:sulfhydrogenase subunit beta (sulfur reductase)